MNSRKRNSTAKLFKCLVAGFIAAAAVLGASSSVAVAAAPAWKMVGVSGPTNLPVIQSETQRVTVAAEGGTFQLGYQAQGTGKPVVHSAKLSFTENSQTATIKDVEPGATIAVGDRVTFASAYEPQNYRTIIACESDCKETGSTVTLSEPATETAEDAEVQLFTKELVDVSGSFQVGEEVHGAVFGYFNAGTTVTAVGRRSLVLSSPTNGEYVAAEGAIAIAGPAEVTDPIPFDASAADVQTALVALPGLTGNIQVLGGPGGVAATPYSVQFGGALVDRDVTQLTLDASALSGTQPSGLVFTPVPGGGGTGEISLSPVNVGGMATAGEYTVRFGPLPDGIVIRSAPHAKEEEEKWSCSNVADEKSVTCTSETVVPSLAVAESIIVPVEVTNRVEMDSSVSVSISGGDAHSDSIQMPVTVSSQPAEQGVNTFLAGTFDANGNPETQAGGHPYSALTFFQLNTVRLPGGYVVPHGDLRTALVDLPPGFSGNPLVTPRCPQALPTPVAGESAASCGSDSRIGVFQPSAQSFGGPPSTFRPAIYNDLPARGYAAEFSSILALPIQSLLASVRSSEDFGIRISALNVPTTNRVYGAFAALEGFPAGADGKPFLSSSTSCRENAREAPVLRAKTETWQEPAKFSLTANASLVAVTGCAALQFSPSFSFRPTVTSGSSGTGGAAILHIPQEGLTDPSKLATPNLKKAVVRLPAGLSLNAAAANGLQSCSEEQIGYEGAGFSLPNPIRFDEAEPSCPDASKLGTVEVNSPLVESPLVGTIYLAAQEENPFDSLLAIYLVVDDARTGITLKLPGELQADPATGQLTATFDYNPQLAFEDLKLVFRGGGPESELATPEVCGHYETTGELEPWSAPESGPPAQIKEGGFDISGDCSGSLSARPFAPSLEAGTTSTQAGAHSPLVIKVNRKDGEQELKSLDFTLPKGLLGRVAGIPYCSEASIRSAQAKSGKAEQSSASCPPASQIGTVDTAAGVGTEPFHVGGKVYLAGPYKGAPLSSVVVTPAVAGPFDLGDVVIRAPLYVDPETAQITAKSDQIPTILRGIPLKVRSVAIYLNRPGFTLNPTSCEPMTVSSSIQGSSGGKAAPSNRFQVGGCKALKFKPKLKINLKGSTTRTGHPGLRAVLTYPKKGAYANIARAQVNLPHSEFLAQGNLNKTCTKPVLLEGKCPKSSIYGRATAWTPLLEKPLQGPVYLVGGYGYKLPALVADLNGQIRVVLKGKVDTGKNKGIRNTFEAVPDAPVSRFVLQLKGGKKYGLLENSENLCKKPQRAISRFTAQNGLVRQIRTPIARQCGKKAKRQGKKARHGGRKH